MHTQLSTAIRCATADANGVHKSAYQKELEAWDEDQANAEREREMRRYGFGKRSSLCG